MTSIHQFQELKATLCKRVADFNEHGSGNVLSHIGECGVQLTNYNPTGVNFILNVLLCLFRIKIVVSFFKIYFIFSGASYIPTPKSIVGKKAVINVKNSDQRCFLYAIASHMLNNTTTTTPQENRKFNKDRPKQYDAIISTLNCEGLTYPVPIKQIPKFEVTGHQ